MVLVYSFYKWLPDNRFLLRDIHLPLIFFHEEKAVALRVNINGCSLTKTLIDTQCVVHLLIPSVYLFQFSSKLSCFAGTVGFIWRTVY